MLINVDIITFSIFLIFINPYTFSLWGSKWGSKFYEFSRQETSTRKGAFLVWLWYNIVVLDKLLITFLDTDKLNSFMYRTFWFWSFATGKALSLEKFLFCVRIIDVDKVKNSFYLWCSPLILWVVFTYPLSRVLFVTDTVPKGRYLSFCS